MAFLGKISAVLTASTADFTKKIGASKQELKSLQQVASGMQLNLNTRALDGTLTRLQKFKRTLEEIRLAQKAGNGPFVDTKALEEQFRVFEDVGKPLTALKNKIEGLSNTLQSGLYPALERVQTGFQGLYRDIGAGATTLDASKDKIQSLLTALTSLSRATAAAQDFGNLASQLGQENVGASFFQPFTRETLQKTLALRNQATNVPSRFRGGVFADLADQAEKNAQRIEEQAARILRVQLRIANEGETPRNLNERFQAQSSMSALTRRQQAINASFERELRSSEIKHVVSPQAETQVDRLTKKLVSVSAELRAIGGTRFDGLISAAAAAVEQLNRGEASAKRAKDAIAGLQSVLSSASTGRSLSASIRSSLFTDTERQAQRIQSDFDRQRAAGDRSAAARRDINLQRLRLNDEILPSNRALVASASQTGDADIVARAEKIARSSRQIANELDKAYTLADSGKLDESNKRYAKANELLDAQSQKVRQLTRDIETSNQARRQQDMFLQASGGRGEQLSQGARDAAASISVARQFRGQIADGASRILIQSEIDRVTDSVTGLQKRIAEVAASDLGMDDKVKELDRLDNEIRLSTKGLAQFIAQLSGGAFNADQIEKAMELAKNTAGSISARSSQVAQLAFQQALFAVDDLVSSTGGLEYKLRAIGNNITQLGLLLGQSGVIPGLNATTGLFIGLSTVLAGQAFSAITRWASGSEDADARARALSDSLSKQKSLVEQLASAFESLGDAISQKAFSDPVQQARSFQKELQEISKKQKELREENAAATDPAVQRERAIQASAQTRLSSEQNPGRRIALQEEIRQSRERERRAISDAVARTSSLPSRDKVASAISLAGSRAFSAVTRGEDTVTVREASLVTDSQNRARAVAGASLLDQRRLLQAQLEDLVKSGAVAVDNAAASSAEELKRLIDSIDLETSIEKVALTLSSVANDASAQIGQANANVAEAIRAGIPSARALETELNLLGDEINGAFSDLEAARDPERTQEDRTRMRAQAERRIADVLRRQQDAIARSDALLRERMVDPQRQIGARFDRARANLNEAGLSNGAAARRIREIEAEREIIAAQTRAFPNDPIISRAAQARDAQLQQEAEQIEAGTLALQRFTEALNRASQEVSGNLQSAQQAADDARRADLANSTPQTQASRRAAESDLRRQQELSRVAQTEIEAARARVETTQMPLEFERLREIQDLLDSGSVTGQRKEDLIRERGDLQIKIDRAIQEDPVAAFARDMSTAEEERRKSAARGRELAMTETERRNRDLTNNAKDVENEVMGTLQRDGKAAAQAQLDSARSNLSQQVAPMVAQFGEEIMTARLQGPSRQSLNVADVGTAEGARELSRLLRGDDPARDVNLEELRKQTDALERLNDLMDKIEKKLDAA